MADKKKSQAAAKNVEQLEPGAQTAEQMHEARREAEREAQAESGMDRHGARENQDS